MTTTDGEVYITLVTDLPLEIPVVGSPLINQTSSIFNLQRHKLGFRSSLRHDAILLSFPLVGDEITRYKQLYYPPIYSIIIKREYPPPVLHS